MSANADTWPDLAGRRAGQGHVLPVRVYYEDTDFSGVVYHAAYLRFLERGRSDFLRLLGVGHRALAARPEGALAFAVRRMALDFLAPGRIDDVLEVRTAFVRLGGASADLRQAVLAEAGARALVRAEMRIALVGADGRPARWPADLAARLKPAASRHP